MIWAQIFIGPGWPTESFTDVTVVSEKLLNGYQFTAACVPPGDNDYIQGGFSTGRLLSSSSLGPGID